MKILVTGGAGFIGSHVVDAYIQLGHLVVVVDNLSKGTVENINPNAHFIQADINNKSEIQKIILSERPEVISLHAAHIDVGNSVKNPHHDATTNILGLLNIMEAAVEVPIKKVIFASTGGAMYGDQASPCTEDLKEQPISPYGISKRASELYLHFYFDLYKIPYCVLRYGNVYGPRQNAHSESGVVAIFCELFSQGKSPVINGSGKNTRDFVYVSDVIRANVLALQSEYSGIINIGTSQSISINDLFLALQTEFKLSTLPIHGPARKGEQKISCLDSTKAKKILGWEPEVNLKKGLALTAAWYKKNALKNNS